MKPDNEKKKVTSSPVLYSSLLVAVSLILVDVLQGIFAVAKSTSIGEAFSVSFTGCRFHWAGIALLVVIGVAYKLIDYVATKSPSFAGIIGVFLKIPANILLFLLALMLGFIGYSKYAIVASAGIAGGSYILDWASTIAILFFVFFAGMLKNNRIANKLSLPMAFVVVVLVTAVAFISDSKDPYEQMNTQAEHLEKMAEVMPKLADATVKLQEIEQSLDADSGMSSYEKQIQYAGLVNQYFENGDIKKAIELNEKLSNEFEKQLNYARFVDFYFKSNDIEKAVEFNKKMSNEFEKQMNYLRFVDVYYKAGNIERAREFNELVTNSFEKDMWDKKLK